MRKLFLLMLLCAGTVAAQDIPSNLPGTWVNEDSQVLMIQLDGHFDRLNPDKSIASSGKLHVCDEGKLHITREDTDDEYDLVYFVGDETFAVTKPHDPMHAWLFRKVGN